MPMGVTSWSQVIYEAFLSEDKTKTFFHGHSYTANPTACSAALASLDLLEKDPAKVKKWKKTKEYNVLKILSENSTLIGPLKAVGFISPSLIKESTVGEDERSFNISSVASFISKNDYLKSKKKPTLNEVMYECEKFIRDQSVSGGLDINSIFADAIEGAVIYVKFDITINGVSEWDVIVSSDIKKIKSGKKAFLRTKNGYTRAADRMGVQI